MYRVVRLIRLLLAAAALALPFAFSTSSHGATSCGAATEVTCENQQPGTPLGTWDVSGAGDASIQGFATDISVNKGDTVNFKIKTNAANYRIDIYRLGWYGGNGARLITSITPSATLPQLQPNCLPDATGLVDCGNWAVSASWQVPADAVSGVYIARPMRLDTLGASHIVFVVRDDASTSQLLFQTSDQTWQAYNRYGGNSLYTGTQNALGNPTERAYKVSYNRPFTTRAYEPASWLFGAEYATLRFLERNGFDVTYTTGVDSDRRGNLIQNHKAFLSVGHDEYWSGGQRANVEAARDSGVNLAFLSGNEIFWKTRWESSIDGSGTGYRTLVCYKESAAGAKIDPSPTWTGNWRDARFSPPADGGRPENGLTGQLYQTSFREDPISVPAEAGKLRFWRNTAMASLPSGGSGTLPTGVLGYEWDVDADNAFRPAGEFDLSSSTFTVNSVFDNGQNPGTITHSLSLYRASSGALVFGAGTIQWAYGLDTTHDQTTSTAVPADASMQQATVNLLADMGAQPGSLMSGLVAASASTDTTAPTSTVTAPAQGALLTAGTPVTVTGTAADTGGRVAGVEVSVDGGHTWHEAAGRSSWTYTFTPGSTGAAQILSRAVDDSGNLESLPARTCPCSIFPATTAPSTPSVPDNNPIELGMKFRSDQAGFISAIRFYKGAANTGTHVGHLWSATGQLLATVNFTNETAAGWQQASLGSPLSIQANTTYVVSYFAPNGGYALDRPYFAPHGADNPPVHALTDGVDGGNGVYFQGGTGFPVGSFNASNYWVDVVYESTAVDRTPPTVVSTVPAAGATNVAASAKVTARFSEPMAPASITTSTLQLRNGSGSLLPAAVAYDSASNSATLTPSSPLTLGATYTATVKGGAGGVTDDSGNALVSDVSWSFTTGTPSSCPCSVFAASAVPATASVGDGNPYELGMRFRSDEDGFVTGVRFYKGPSNTGAHVGHLWSNAGVLLGTVSFSGESASGWQQANFTTPVAVQANTTYVVSYTAPNGGFALDRPGFASGIDTPPLHALADGVDGANGVYAQGGGGFPNQSFGSSNYWVDVVFDTSAVDRTPPTVVSTVPVAGATNVAVSTVVSARFNEAMAAGSITGSSFELRNGSGGLVAAAVAYDAASKTATLTPSSPLAASSSFTATVKGTVTDLAGNALGSDLTWSFTTGTPASCPCSVWTGSATPATASVPDTNSYELGMKFRSDQNGFVSAIRFYKGASNTGAHVGHLWTATGTLLGTVNFTSETATGWQQASFGSPVAINANTTYIVSYTAPSGGYALDRPGFGSSIDTPPLHALADGTDGPNGVYGVGGTFPTQSFGASNYWVDLVFTLGTPPTVDAKTPADGATGVATTVAPTATFSKAIDQSTLTASSFYVKPNGGPAVAATISYDSGTRTATLTPASALAASTQYTVTVTTDVKSTEGVALAATVSWSFTTGTPLTVTGQTPADGATGVLTTVAPTATFSKDVNQATLTASSFKLAPNGGPAVAATITYNAASKTATLTPAALLASLTTYTVTVTTAVTATDGSTLSATFSWSFTTNNAPTVTATNPANGATGVSPYIALTATFSRAMNAATFTTSNVTLWRPDNTQVPVSPSYNSATLTLTMTPTVTLDYSKTYTAKLSTGITAADGVPLAAQYSWQFTTNGTGVFWRTNAGGGAYTAGSGAVFQADTGFTGGTANVTTNVITGTPDPALYQDERTGASTITYQANLPNGTYDVKLHHVELKYSAVGSRVFNVDITQTTANPDIANLDIFKEVGKNVADVKTISNVVVTGGAIRIRFLAVTDVPEIAAIEIIPQIPTVTARTPASGATGVSRSTTVTATFSRAMDPTSLTSSTFTLTPNGGGAPVQASVTYNSATNTATLTPVAQLAAGTVYTAKLDTTVRATDGMTLQSAVSWSFTTGP